MITIPRQLSFGARSLCRVQLYVIKLARGRSRMSKPIVRVKDGKLQGATEKSVLGPSYVAFYDVPFAAPPVGELRFKDPQPPAPWEGIKDVSQSTVRVALQVDENPPNKIVGDEDCLYLNVYTTSLTGCKPVMFWIHGGGFTVGTASSKIKKPDYLMTKDVVLVSANYRLGAFGFLNLGHRVAPGNMGLKDLIQALEWIKENIANFGGDPNNVTIFGASAGGALSHALTLSPRARGLFHKAILQSGTVTCPWAMVRKPESNYKLAKILGKDSTDPEEVVKFLRTVPAEDIIKAQSEVATPEEVTVLNLPFSLTRDDVAENPVLPSSIEELPPKDAHIPVMVGCTSHEFIMFFKDTSEKTINGLNRSLPAHVKRLGELKKSNRLDDEKLLKAVKEWYLRGGPVTEETIEGAIQFLGDVYFGIPARLFVEDRVRRDAASTFFYVYSYVGNELTHTDMLVKRQLKGASHVDEMSYIFYMPVYKIDNPNPPAEGTRDRNMIECMTRLWTNFARTGNPTPSGDDFIKTTWQPATKDKVCYLNIDEKLEMLVAQPHVLGGTLASR